MLRHRGWIVVARLGNQVVGVAIWDYLEGESVVLPEEVAVLPRYQCRGIGTALVLEVALRAQALSFTSVWATALSGDGEEPRTKWLNRIGVPATIVRWSP